MAAQIATAPEMWTSKLGNKYPKRDVEANHDRNLALLRKLRSDVPANRSCADCGLDGTVWSSVNLGVFTCIRCGSLHRALGTHISKPKGCTGTYLWGPDEIARMREMGNERAALLYGGTAHRPTPDAPDSAWLSYLRDKYERKKFAGESNGTAVSIGGGGEEPSAAPRSREKEGGANSRASAAPPTADLLGLNDSPQSVQKSGGDFFAQFGL